MEPNENNIIPDNYKGLDDSPNQEQPEQDQPNIPESKEATKKSLTEPVSWQATDGSHRARSTSWYIIFAIVVVGLMALAIFVFKSVTFAILIPVMAVAIITLSPKTAQVINYSISPKGIYIADKLYDFSEFRAFGVTLGETQSSITILPVKRFSLAMTIYFPNDQGEIIVDMLGARLPMQEIKPDSIEKLIRLIRL